MPVRRVEWPGTVFTDLLESDVVTDSNQDQAPITLDQFLKITGLVGTGGQAKIAIQEGYVTVNGDLETRRRRKLAIGDVIVVDNQHPDAIVGIHALIACLGVL